MKKILILMIFAGVFVSCNKSYFDINDNPNSPTELSITTDLLAAGALSTSGNISTGGVYVRSVGGAATTTRFSMLGRWLGIWSPGTNFAASDESKYQAASVTSTPTWRNHYDNINDYQALQIKANATGQTFYEGIAKIMKAWNYHQLVDMFGNVPYSQATNASIIQPKYDRGDSIYVALFKEITTGINLIKNATVANNNKISSADIMFKGNQTKWAKFGNTLKLRLLIHESQLPNISSIVTTEMAIINAEGSGFLGAGETAGVNPGYSAASANPYWTTHMYGNGCTPVPDNFNRANNFSLNTLKNLNDIRYQYFYLPIRGVANFLTTTNPADWKGIDYAPTNSDPAFTEGKLSDIGGARTCTPSASQQVGLGKSPTMDSWVITSFESLFLQAEAKARGWISGGPSAQTLYNSAVTESFEWLKVTNAAATAATYLAQSDNRIAWPAAAADQYKVIAWQKYFAFNGNNHLEIWNDYRRLDAVNIPLSVDAGRGSNPIPVRLLYPDTEYNFNATNVGDQGTINAFTSKVFWDL